MYLLVVVLIALPEVASFPASLSLASVFQLCSIKKKLARDRGYQYLRYSITESEPIVPKENSMRAWPSGYNAYTVQ